MKKLKVLVLSGGISSEHEVSLCTGKMVTSSLDKTKYDVESAIIEKNGKWHFSFSKEILDIEDSLKLIREKDFDIVFIALHGEFGEDGKMQALFDSIGQKYTGSKKEASKKGLDKALSNQVFEKSGLAVPKYFISSKDDKELAQSIGFPLVVKPLKGGSSLGVSIVDNNEKLVDALEEAFEFEDNVMVQEFIEGREFSCGVLEKEGKAFPLLPTEIIPLKSKFFDFKAKYEIGGSNEVTPPDLSSTQIAEIQKLAQKAHDALGCQGISRTDFILKDGKFYVLEINTLPGMTETSIVPQEAKALGIDFKELLDLIITAGLKES